jgi:hypothetical protein
MLLKRPSSKSVFSTDKPDKIFPTRSLYKLDLYGVLSSYSPGLDRIMRRWEMRIIRMHPPKDSLIRMHKFQM